MDFIRKIMVTGIFIYTLLPVNSLAMSNEGKIGLFGEMGWRDDPAAFVAEAGVAGYLTDNLSARAAFIFFAEENLVHTYGGISGGLRLNLGEEVSPFIGAGFFYGTDEEDVPADNDGIDNDRDGTVDEAGETKEVVTDSIFTIYPEAGIHVWLSDNFRITWSNKYYQTNKGIDHNFWMTTGGITLFY